MAEGILREIRDLLRGPSNEGVERSKASGRPVVGYFCAYVPAEVILAAGALPLRLRAAGSRDSSRGDALMSGRICTYVRHVMSLVLEGRYDFLDGEVGSNTCDHVRRARDVFVKKTALPFHGFVSVPRSPRESLFAYYLEEVRRLYHDLGRHLGREPSDDALREAVRALNENRRRLSEVNRLRLEDRPRLSGSDALAVHIAAQVLPPSVFGSLADRLLEALRRHPGIASPRGRLLLLGAELNEPEYVDAIESQGALVVADRLCFGARSVLEPIDDQAPDPLAAIARAYFFRPSCARMIGDFPNRWAALQSLVADARADGVVLERLLFCDPWGAEVHNLSLRAKAAGLPLLVLQRECGIVPAGQIKTRVQAFLEKLEGDRTRGGAAGEAP